MIEALMITTTDGRAHWARPNVGGGSVIWRFIENRGELQVSDQRPTAADLEQPDFGVPVSFNPAHIVSIARFPCL